MQAFGFSMQQLKELGTWVYMPVIQWKARKLLSSQL